MSTETGYSSWVSPAMSTCSLAQNSVPGKDPPAVGRLSQMPTLDEEIFANSACTVRQTRSSSRISMIHIPKDL